MTVHQLRRLTPPEEALIANAEAGLVDGDDARRSAIATLRRDGLPHRRVEAWHYTDLKTLLRGIPEDAPAPMIEKRAALVSGAPIAYVMHGKAVDSEIEGFKIESYAESLTDGTAAAALVAASKDDAIGRINGSFVRDGLSVVVPDDADIEQPLELQAIHGAGQVHSRFPVTFGKGSKATIIERHLSVTDEAAFVSSVSEIEVQDGAEATYVILQQQGAAISAACPIS